VPAASEELATALADRYEIERLIGEGGMATVYLARDIRHNRRVALKVLRPDLGAVVGVERFLAEIQVTANLQHPNLLPLFDSGAAGELLYYVMPYVQGESLRARLDREKQLPVEEAIRLATAIGGALDYAHRQGVIHRDLKPENVLLQEGQPLVADFGIALAVSNAGGTRITQTGLSLGTPHYMSPEQATGDRAIDGRTDIYSLGALTYEMLTGEPPHTGSTSQAIIARVLTERPRRIRASRSAVPEYVEAAVERALEKLPADRWASAREFVEGLTGARPVTRSTTSASAAVTAVAPSSIRRLTVREGAAWALAVTGIAVAAWAITRTGPPPPPLTRFAITLPDSVDATGSSLATMPSVAFSPDGSTMAFVGRVRAGGVYVRSRIFVRRLADTEAREIVGTEGASRPTFSPDGEWLAYVGLDRGLRKIPVAGGTPQLLTDSVSSVSWGDDGAIYFARLSSGIWRLGTDGAEPEQLIAPDSVNGILTLGYLDVLPGSRAALTRVRAVNGVFYTTIADLRARRLGNIRLTGMSVRYAAPGFLVFDSDEGVISAIRFSLRKSETEGTAIRIADRVGGLANGGMDFAVAPDGAVAIRWSRETQLGPTRIVQAGTRGDMRLIRSDAERYDQPRLSPDGRQLLVRIGASTYNTGDLWVLELSSGALTRLTTGNNSYRASWSRDGKLVYYLTGNPGTSKVMAKPWDGSGRDSVVLDRPEIAEFVPGPPGGWSVLRNYGQRDIMLVSTDSIATATPRLFVTGPSNETDPALSPSGTLLAYQSDETGPPQVYLRPVPGPGPRVPVSIGGGTKPFWSRDGRELYYLAGTTVMAATITEQPSLAVVRRDSLFQAEFIDDGVNLAVLPAHRSFIAAVGDDRRPAVPWRIDVISNWQSLFAAPRVQR
jgi:serine/threonine-protein kinase